MNISELISHLENLRRDHGDMPCYIEQFKGPYELSAEDITATRVIDHYNKTPHYTSSTKGLKVLRFN